MQRCWRLSSRGDIEPSRLVIPAIVTEIRRNSLELTVVELFYILGREC
jgi:hypothetical protein